jgi:eukaryotic-like serine/threonine-protein kinase
LDDIGRYRIVGELGSGGMGVVYRAYDPVLGREVAIKTLKLSDLSDPAERNDLRERLGREARAAGALSHPGIVGVHDVVQQGDVIGLVMELIEGQTLAAVLYQSPLAIDNILRVIREAASALDYAHRKGIVHRDIKPANIMLDENAAVKIADFGIAKITTSTTRTQSASGLIVGTAGYMAPEQLRGATIEGRTDQFSLAVVAYEMLARRRPFMADSMVALTHQVVFEEAPTLSTLRPGLGAGVDAVFHTALAKNPANRFATCTAFATALEEQLNSSLNAATMVLPNAIRTAPNPIPTRPPTTQPPAPSRSIWPFAVGLLILGVLAIPAAIYLARRGAPVQKSVPVVSAKADPPKVPAATPAPVEKAPEPVVETKEPAPAKTPAPTHTTPPAAKTGGARVNRKDGQKYVWIPPGKFAMGCVENDPNCGAFAKPAHTVNLTKGFWMAETLTTVAAYKAFNDAAHREMPKAPKFNAEWKQTDHPMVEVNYDDAVAYCTRAGGRLPTEAEFEYAARAGAAGTLFPWGNDATHDLANFGLDARGKDEAGAIEGKDQWLNTSPVASFAPNAFHLYDMVGNASEWCSDWWGQNYYRQSPTDDPKGPETGTLKINRGGSWKSPSKLLHSSYRGSRAPDDRGMTTGFRCVVNNLP